MTGETRHVDVNVSLLRVIEIDPATYPILSAKFAPNPT
jgi:hypothetical protein